MVRSYNKFRKNKTIILACGGEIRLAENEVLWHNNTVYFRTVYTKEETRPTAAGNEVMGMQTQKTDARRRSGPARKGSTQKKKSKKRRSGPKKVFLAILICILVAVIILLTPIFSISHININPISVYQQETIASTFDGIRGKNGFLSLFKSVSFSNLDDIFRLRFGNLEKSMLFDYPLIKSVTIKYDLPRTLDVEIEERTPIMIIKSNGMFLEVDSEGYLLGSCTLEEQTDMPVIEGVEIADYKIGASITGGKSRTLDNAIKICSIMKQLSMLSYIDIIDISDYNNIWMYCAPSLSIKFGDAEDIGRKLSYIKGIIDSGHDGDSNGTLDMSTGGNPIFRNNEPASDEKNDPQDPQSGQ